MRTKWTIVVVGLMLCLGTVARASDMCLLDDYGSTLVGPRFKFPSAGRCSSFNGYLNGNGNGCLISGAACGTSDNGRVKFNLTYTCTTSPNFGTYFFAIDRANSYLSEAGYGGACQPDTSGTGNWTCTQFHLNQITCPVPHDLSTFP